MQQVRGYFDDAQPGFVDPTGNSPVKRNSTFQEEEKPATPDLPFLPGPSKPKAEAALIGDIKKPSADILDFAPAKRSGIAQGEERANLLKAAGIETDEARNVRQSGERQAAKQVNVGGQSFANPMEPGIDPLEQARRYQEVAARAPNTEHGRFANKELLKLAKDPVLAQALKGEVAGERADAAAQAQAAKDAEDKRRFEADFGLKQNEEKRKAEMQPLDLDTKRTELESKKTELGVAKATAGERAKAEGLKNQELLASGEDKRSNAEIRRKNYELDRERFADQKENKAQDDFFKDRDDYIGEEDKKVDMLSLQGNQIRAGRPLQG
jgi:hypothetical protein